MKNYKLVIFDWDGTLMDSVARIVSSMRAAAVAAELPVPTTEAVKNIIGLSLPEVFNILFPRNNQEAEERLKRHYKNQYIELDNTPTPLFDYAIELLDQLKEQSVTLAVATGKGREGLNRVMDESNLTQYFQATRCADESASKPAPDMIIQLLKELGITAADAVMIGDSVHDMAMAQNANIDRIGVTMGVGDAKALAQYQPIAVVDSLLELLNLLTNLRK